MCFARLSDLLEGIENYDAAQSRMIRRLYWSAYVWYVGQAVSHASAACLC